MAAAKKPSKRFLALRSRSLQICQRLAEHYPEALCALEHETPFQLLAATILSAQCTDERVNIVTRVLFRKYPTAEKLAKATQAQLEAIVKSTGFFRNKAANLLAMAQTLVEKYAGEPPVNLEQLIELPGVGRKTANVLLGTWYGIPSGVVVDTHVKRISGLLGLARETSPEKIEVELGSLLPDSEWIMYSHRIIHHGRAICIARRPKCDACPLLDLCDRVGL